LEVSALSKQAGSAPQIVSAAGCFATAGRLLSLP